MEIGDTCSFWLEGVALVNTSSSFNLILEFQKIFDLQIKNRKSSKWKKSVKISNLQSLVGVIGVVGNILTILVLSTKVTYFTYIDNISHFTYLWEYFCILTCIWYTFIIISRHFCYFLLAMIMLIFLPTVSDIGVGNIWVLSLQRFSAWMSSYMLSSLGQLMSPQVHFHLAREGNSAKENQKNITLWELAANQDNGQLSTLLWWSWLLHLISAISSLRIWGIVSTCCW